MSARTDWIARWAVYVGTYIVAGWIIEAIVGDRIAGYIAALWLVVIALVLSDERRG